MSSMFGHKWTSSYGAEVDPDRVWLATLDGVSADQIKTGLSRLRERGDEWPPSAPEFRKLCLATELDNMLPQQRATLLADQKREAERRRQLEHKPDPEQLAQAREQAMNDIFKTMGMRRNAE